MHTLADSTLHNLDVWPFDLRVNECRGPPIEYIRTKFGVNILQSADAQMPLMTHNSATQVWIITTMMSTTMLMTAESSLAIGRIATYLAGKETFGDKDFIS